MLTKKLSKDSVSAVSKNTNLTKKSFFSKFASSSKSQKEPAVVNDVDETLFKNEKLFQKSFNVYSNNLEERLTNNDTKTLSLEEVVLALVIKYSKIEVNDIRKDVRPRFYVKARLEHESKQTRKIVHDADFKQLAPATTKFGKVSSFMSKHVLQNIDKPINAISRFFATHIGDRYEVQENGLLHAYEYQYVDQRTEAERRKGVEKPFSLSMILHPSVKLMSGYFLRSHIETRIIINKEVTMPKNFDLSPDKLNYNKFIKYYAFFFDFKPTNKTGETFTLYKNGKEVKKNIKASDLLTINCKEFVKDNETSAHVFNNYHPIVNYNKKRFHFIIDYKNTKDKSLFNDIFNVLEYCENNKIKIYDLYNMYIYVIKNLDKYMSGSGRSALFVYDKRSIDKRMKNVIAVLKMIKNTDTIEKGYLNFNDLKFKDTRKGVIRILITLITLVAIDGFLLPGTLLFNIMHNANDVATGTPVTQAVVPNNADPNGNMIQQLIEYMKIQQELQSQPQPIMPVNTTTQALVQINGSDPTLLSQVGISPNSAVQSADLVQQSAAIQPMDFLSPSSVVTDSLTNYSNVPIMNIEFDSQYIAVINELIKEDPSNVVYYNGLIQNYNTMTAYSSFLNDFGNYISTLPQNDPNYISSFYYFKLYSNAYNHLNYLQLYQSLNDYYSATDPLKFNQAQIAAYDYQTNLGRGITYSDPSPIVEYFNTKGFNFPSKAPPLDPLPNGQIYSQELLSIMGDYRNFIVTSQITLISPNVPYAELLNSPTLLTLEYNIQDKINILTTPVFKPTFNPYIPFPEYVPSPTNPNVLELTGTTSIKGISNISSIQTIPAIRTLNDVINYNTLTTAPPIAPLTGTQFAVSDTTAGYGEFIKNYGLISSPDDFFNMNLLSNPKLFIYLMQIGLPVAIEQFAAYVAIEYGITIAGDVADRLVTYNKVNITKTDLDKMVKQTKSKNPKLKDAEIERKLDKIRQDIYKKYYSNITTDAEMEMYLNKIKNSKFSQDEIDSSSKKTTLSSVNDNTKRSSTILGFLKTFSTLRYLWNFLVRTQYSFIKYLSSEARYDNLIFANYRYLKQYKGSDARSKINYIQENIPTILNGEDTYNIFRRSEHLSSNTKKHK